MELKRKRNSKVIRKGREIIETERTKKCSKKRD